ncbi:MAG: hypothetical protein ACRCWR_10980 [Saezia sp.]
MNILKRHPLLIALCISMLTLWLAITNLTNPTGEDTLLLTVGIIGLGLIISPYLSCPKDSTLLVSNDTVMNGISLNTFSIPILGMLSGALSVGSPDTAPTQAIAATVIMLSVIFLIGAFASSMSLIQQLSAKQRTKTAARYKREMAGYAITTTAKEATPYSEVATFHLIALHTMTSVNTLVAVGLLISSMGSFSVNYFSALSVLQLLFIIGFKKWLIKPISTPVASEATQ